MTNFDPSKYAKYAETISSIFSDIRMLDHDIHFIATHTAITVPEVVKDRILWYASCLQEDWAVYIESRKEIDYEQDTLF
jgi:hypothetical protein